MKAAIIMGSDSDFPALKPAIKTLMDFGINFDVHVMSAHRSPERAEKFAKAAYEEGYRVLICAAGKAAHLAGVIAANTAVPVIGIPIKSSTLDGLDSLLSTVQMPKGIPVATVAIDGSENAALLAVQILAVSDKNLYEKLLKYKKDMDLSIREKDAEIKKAVSEMQI